MGTCSAHTRIASTKKGPCSSSQGLQRQDKYSYNGRRCQLSVSAGEIPSTARAENEFPSSGSFSASRGGPEPPVGDVDAPPSVGVQNSSTSISESKEGRRIVFACDGTENAREGLRWSLKYLIREGDVVDLAHVVSDERTPATAVGSSTATTQWTVPREAQASSREFMGRVEQSAKEMIDTKFSPEMMFRPGVEHSVKLLRLRTHKSAASIGETLSEHCNLVDADLLFIASHGAGVLSDYGSVARWCAENSSVPSLLLPPQVLSVGSSPETSAACSNTVVVAAIGNLDSLRNAFEFAVKKIAKAQDNIYLILVKSVDSEDAAVSLRKEIVSATLVWQEELAASNRTAATVNVAVDLVTNPVSKEGSFDMEEESSVSDELGPGSPAGEQLCKIVKDFQAQALVLKRHGHSTAEEIQFGPFVTHCLRTCERPLVLLQ